MSVVILKATKRLLAKVRVKEGGEYNEKVCK